MAEPETPRSDELDKPKAKPPGRGDALALGIGCLIFLIFFGAIVIVNIMRD